MSYEIRTIVTKLRQLHRKIGTLKLAVYIVRRLLGRQAVGLSRVDVLGFYAFTRRQPFGQALPAGLPKKTVNWVIPDFAIGSGGHVNIFRFVAGLEEMGFECRIVIVGPSHCQSGAQARAAICEHFNPVRADVVLGEEGMQPAFFTIATSWQTAYYVRNFNGTSRKCYFVQDFEPFFFAHGSEYLLAEQTYRFGFTGITAGDWLAAKLAADYGMQTRAIGFSYDRHLYAPQPRKAGGVRQVFFYARPPTPRRAFELGIMVLDAIAKKLPDVHFILAGWDTSGYALPFPHRNAGSVALADLPALYRECDAALVLSLTNLSLLPLELMACGCPVVSNRGPNVEWLLTPEVAVLADPTVEALSEAVVALLDDEGRRQALIEAGLALAERTDWAREAEKFARTLEDMIEEKTPA